MLSYPHKPDVGNDSGTGPMAKLPPELEGWNWGAFLMTLWWSLSHSAWIGLLVLLGAVPRVGWIPALIMSCVLGKNGNLWAWQNRRWDDVEHFKATQRIWAWWGAGTILVSLLGIMVSLSAMNSAQSSARPGSATVTFQETDPDTGKIVSRPATEEERRLIEAQSGQKLDP